jgi:three-Cys-motif partner protein
MRSDEIEDKPYAEGTLTKLQIFELYARAWLPVFTSSPNPIWKKLHLFDFFAGRGQDCNGIPGSPLRLLSEVKARSGDICRKHLKVTVTVCDDKPDKIEALSLLVQEKGLAPDWLQFDPHAGDFTENLPYYLPILADPKTACLVLLDQYGFKHVGADVFQRLAACPRTDILFFISTDYLHRFREHPAIRKYFELEKVGDHYHAHREVLNWYRSQIPRNQTYYLAAFSFKKGTNLYCVIFGSGHPKGMAQFLSVAWKMDPTSGEADYDLNRENFNDLAPYLGFEMFRPRKVQIFEAALEKGIRELSLTSETDLYLFCLENGMLPIHASPVIKRLRKDGVIACAFTSPRIDSLKSPRPFQCKH